VNLQLVPVAPSGTLTFACCACGKRADQNHAPVYADHDGEPFKAYYCAECAKEAA